MQTLFIEMRCPSIMHAVTLGKLNSRCTSIRENKVDNFFPVGDDMSLMTTFTSQYGLV
jgi:hypothetical protein